MELTATEYVFHCTPSTNTSGGNTFFALVGYELVNTGGTGVSVTVFMTLGGSVIAEHDHGLAPYESVNDTIGATLAYAGNCQAPPVGLGMSWTFAG